MKLDTGAVLEALRRWQDGQQTVTYSTPGPDTKPSPHLNQESPAGPASGLWTFRTYTDVLHAESMPPPAEAVKAPAATAAAPPSQRARQKGGGSEAAAAAHGPSPPPGATAALFLPATTSAARPIPEALDPGLSDEDAETVVCCCMCTPF